jgi:shikimate kinase
MSALTLVCGPPCAGKTTWANATGERVLDWDHVYSQVSGLPVHKRYVDDPRISRDVESRFRLLFDANVATGAPLVVIRGAPERWQRGMYRRIHQARVVVLEVPVEECVRRLHASQRPLDVIAATEAGIRGWWARYQPSPRDELVRWQPEAAA